MIAYKNELVAKKIDNLSSILMCVLSSMELDIISFRDAKNIISEAVDLTASLVSTFDKRELFSDISETSGRKVNLFESVGDRICKMRKLRGLNHFQLATKVGVTRSCEEAWEENVTVPASDKIIPLSEALNCDPLWLLTGEG
ncbi:hypothetical protein GC087_06640 [Pantoea sp. JZ2]|uniref:helix-turn-helix domain-containing protein n=1 Tax=Pantoea sp. JZ2 TaxID=2654189 RepID=UPI002B46E038|nr:helix-turn-helix transcriptional regulator [Pantoea sp. JZ2]WRH12312.1 hypothetical protein GC087_06640 [Pantoea sp. JZ2]